MEEKSRPVLDRLDRRILDLLQREGASLVLTRKPQHCMQARSGEKRDVDRENKEYRAFASVAFFYSEGQPRSRTALNHTLMTGLSHTSYSQGQPWSRTGLNHTSNWQGQPLSRTGQNHTSV